MNKAKATPKGGVAFVLFFASKYVSLRKKNLLILLTELEIFDIKYTCDTNKYPIVLNVQCGKINRY